MLTIGHAAQTAWQDLQANGLAAAEKTTHDSDHSRAVAQSAQIDKRPKRQGGPPRRRTKRGSPQPTELARAITSAVTARGAALGHGHDMDTQMDMAERSRKRERKQQHYQKEPLA